ncbi:HTH araC/xylS-type domain-containing protein [Flavobacterium longum]|uniref:AraC family transcriptional regulator n=1 Tax=Flavobacterium longum TaxID=1299340 RepID=UPI0039EA8FFD
MATTAKLVLKNMVCPRCISSVERIFAQSGIPVLHVALGEVAFETMPDETSLDEVKGKLADAGFEVIETRLHKLVEDIRRLIAQYLSDIGQQKTNLSAFITASIPYDYSYLSDVFSSVEGKSIEQYFILLRIEKVKESLVYDQFSLTEIAFQLGFSSVHHLSAQFKKVTGLTPSHFKAVGAARRRPLDKI